MSEAGKLRKSHFRTWGSRQGEMGEEEGMSEKEQASKMCSFETLLFLISFSGFGEANCMFIRIHYLSVSDITPFLLFSHSSLSNIHININIKKYFSVVFPRFLFLSLSPVQDTPIFTCAFVEPAHLTIIPLLGSLFECVLRMLQTESAFFLLPFVCSTQAISSSNSSRNLVKWSV